MERSTSRKSLECGQGWRSALTALWRALAKFAGSAERLFESLAPTEPVQQPVSRAGHRARTPLDEVEEPDELEDDVATLDDATLSALDEVEIIQVVRRPDMADVLIDHGDLEEETVVYLLFRALMEMMVDELLQPEDIDEDGTD